MASIFVISADRPNKVDYYPLGKHTMVVGREETATIQVIDKQVSRKHMQISYDKENCYYFVVDMNSSNGILVNGKMIRDELILSDGDQIHIGNSDILFTIKEFPNRENALNNFKKTGERKFTTL